VSHRKDGLPSWVRTRGKGSDSACKAALVLGWRADVLRLRPAARSSPAASPPRPVHHVDSCCCSRCLRAAAPCPPPCRALPRTVLTTPRPSHPQPSARNRPGERMSHVLFPKMSQGYTYYLPDAEVLPLITPEAARATRYVRRISHATLGTAPPGGEAVDGAGAGEGLQGEAAARPYDSAHSPSLARPPQAPCPSHLLHPRRRSPTSSHCCCVSRTGRVYAPSRGRLSQLLGGGGAGAPRGEPGGRRDDGQCTPPLPPCRVDERPSAVIIGHHRSSYVIKCNQWSSFAIRGQSAALRGHSVATRWAPQRPSEVLSGSSEVIRGAQRHSEVIRDHSEPLRGSQWHSAALRGTQRALGTRSSPLLALCSASKHPVPHICPTHVIIHPLPLHRCCVSRTELEDAPSLGRFEQLIGGGGAGAPRGVPGGRHGEGQGTPPLPPCRVDQRPSAVIRGHHM
jgi:hypothetical protein